MAPIPLWSGNLRLSLVLVPVKLFPAVGREGSVSFRMIDSKSGEAIKYQKGIETDRGFKEVPEEEIVVWAMMLRNRRPLAPNHKPGHDRAARRIS